MRISERAALAAAAAFGVPVENVAGYDKRREMVEARWAAMWILRQCGFSTTRIGRDMRRDHTTVLHGLREMWKRAEADEDYADGITRAWCSFAAAERDAICKAWGLK